MSFLDFIFYYSLLVVVGICLMLFCVLTYVVYKRLLIIYCANNLKRVPYLMDDGVFQMEGFRAHIRRCDYNAVLSMDAIGLNIIEIYIMGIQINRL